MMTTCERMRGQQCATLQSSNAREILFIDAAVKDYATLISGTRPEVEVVVLRSEQSGIEQISRVLQQHSNLTTVHLVSHGTSGALQLGNITLNRQTLSQFAPQLQSWSDALSAQAELLLYGCEVAKGEQGRHLIWQLSELTGATVAASTTLTGSAELGGDWQLQVQTGTIRSDLAFQPDALANYAAVLAAGDLDLTFSGDGIVLTDFLSSYNESGRSVLVQPDGKIVVAGIAFLNSGDSNFALTRYNTDGSLDTSFGSGGQVTSTILGLDGAFGVTIQSDGKLIAVGKKNNGDVAVIRYNTNGILDSTFGGTGIVSTNLGGIEQAESVVVDATGGILVAGRTTAGGLGTNFTLIRYNSNGAVDTSFGSGGAAYTDFNGQADLGFSTKLQSDGKILVAGYANNDTGFGQNFNFALARYNSNGTLDISFGGLGTGKVTTEFIGFGGEQDIGRSVLVQSDGKIVVGGFTYIGEGRNFALARYNADGSLDNTFGIDGRVVADFSDYGSFDAGFSLAQQSDGKIILAGSTDADYASRTRGSDRFAVMRFNTNGAIDASFGNNGRVSTNITDGFDVGYGVTLQADGKIVVAGEAGGKFAVVRYLNDVGGSTPTNQPPVATDDSVSTTESTPLNITAATLLGNDTDPNSDPLSITGTTNPTNGTLVKNADGSYTYTPNPSFLGADSFTYTVSDGKGGTDTATVNITVGAITADIIGTEASDILNGDINPPVINNVIRGLAGNDTIRGLTGNDIIFGDAGNDKINGGVGADNMNGGAGNDIYTVDNAGDTVTEAINNGNKDVVNSSITWTLGPNTEELVLTGTSAINGTGNELNNRIVGNSAANILTGNDGNDTLDARGGNDQLFGGNGTDRLLGGDGNDILDGGTRGDSVTGGAGQDTFIIREAPIGGIETITDFNPADDTLQISKSSFGLSLPLGTLPANAFGTGTSATTATERFVYDQPSGDFFFDPDGSGITAQVKIAKFTNSAALTNTDIVIIA